MKAITLALALLVAACSASVGNGDVAAPDVVTVDEDVTRTEDVASQHDAAVDVTIDRNEAGTTVMDVSADAPKEEDVVKVDDALEPGMLMARVVPLGTMRLVDGENRLSVVHLWSTGRPVGTKKLTYDIFPMIPMGGAVRWLPEDIRVEVGGRVPLGMRLRSWDDVNGSAQAARVHVVFRDEYTIDQSGVDVALFGRPSTMPQSLEGVVVTFRVRPAPYFHGPDEGALTPDEWAPITGSENLGPHIYHGGGFCSNLVMPLNPNPGNVSFGVIMWSPRTAFNHNDFDCQHGGTTDWRNWADTTDPIRGGYSLEQWLVYE